jgi:Na+(H+)/acetate symporter ActP
MPNLVALIQAQGVTRLLSLRFVDVVIILLYFLMILGIGFYLKRYTKTGEDFFLAGRQMTALNPAVQPISDVLRDKHFLRKHGASAYYGQEKKKS